MGGERVSGFVAACGLDGEGGLNHRGCGGSRW